MKLFHVTCALIVATALSACGPAGNAPANEAVPAVAPPAPAVPEATPAAPASTAARLWFDPAALSACEKAGKVVVSWDASAVPGLENVELKTVRGGGEEGQFARAGVSGSKETGPWMSAGRVIILRNAGDGAELARATVGSLPCD